MVAPLQGRLVPAIGTGAVLDAAAEVLALLGADVIRVARLAGPVHAARLVELEPLAALVSSDGGAFDDPPFPVVTLAPEPDPLEAWARSGAMALTGGPAPGELVPRLLGAGAALQLLAASAFGTVLDLDPLALLAERAALAGLAYRPPGTTSVGGACHLLHAADGWVALNLPRVEDIESVPALLDGEVDAGDWPGVVGAVARRRVDELVERAALLGLPLGAWPGPGGRRSGAPWRIDGRVPRRIIAGGTQPPRHEPSPPVGEPLVVDLSSLWAGPLAGGLLAAAGARVVKVESTGRPDGARRGPAAFYDLLNHGKESVALDFTDPSDLDVLRALVARADIVIEASRPRVMPSLGIDPAAVAASGRTTWISISGHGRIGAGANRVAFGDDAAVAAGCTIGDPPRFVADAAADPIAGIYAACAGLAACAGERGQLIDIALVDAAAYACGGRIGAVTDAGTHAVAAPHARPVPGRAAPLGRDTDAVRAQLA